MTELDDAMKKHMTFLIYTEHRPFSFKDFKYFQINQKSYEMKHGTFRNKISNIIQNGEVEIHVKSNPNFYTLKGCRFHNGKSMTGKPHGGYKYTKTNSSSILPNTRRNYIW